MSSYIKNTLEQLRTCGEQGQKAADLITESGLNEILASTEYALVGPLALCLKGGKPPLTACCQALDRLSLHSALEKKFGKEEGFIIKNTKFLGIPSTYASLNLGNSLQMEIIAQPIPLEEQALVKIHGFTNKLLSLKTELKTKLEELLSLPKPLEQALAEALGLEGDPVASLQKLADMEDWEYKIRIG